MDRIAASLLTAILAFIQAPVAVAQELWQGTTAGMSVAEVQQVIPEAFTPQTPERLANGAEALLRKNGVEIVNRKFDAHFYFQSGRLSQVMLEMEKGSTFHGAFLIFESLTEILRAKYGQELNRKVDRGQLYNTAQASWLTGRTNITLFAFGVAANGGLNIVYQTRIAQEADKL